MTKFTVAMSLMLLVVVPSAVVAAEVCHLKPGCCVGRSFEETYQAGNLFIEQDLAALGVMMDRGAILATKDLIGAEVVLQPEKNYGRVTALRPFHFKGSPDTYWAWENVLDCPSVKRPRKK
jgi:hypothetical protein